MVPFSVLGFTVIVCLLAWNFFLQSKLTTAIHLEKKQWTRAESNVATNEMLILWIKQEIGEKKIVDYFRKCGISRIAIYGMTSVGVMLYKILEDTDITVVSGIDRGWKILNLPINIYKPSEFQANVDAIVVASIYYFSEIYDTLRKTIGDDIPIIGLDEIIFDIAENLPKNKIVENF